MTLDLPEKDKDFSKYSRMERIAWMVKWIEQFGLFNLSVTSVAKKFGKSRQQIYRDLDFIKKSYFDLNELSTVKIELFAFYKQAISELRMRLAKGIKKHKDDPEGIDLGEYHTIINELQQIGYNLTKFLEAFELKAPPAPMFSTTTNVAIQQNVASELENVLKEAEELVRERTKEKLAESA